MTTQHVVIIGGGHGGAQAAASVRAADPNVRISLVCGEGRLPYHRPPLSKSYIKTLDAQAQVIRAAMFYETNRIDIWHENAASVDRVTRVVTLQNSRDLPFDWLVLATGSRSRFPPGIPDAGFHQLRDLTDAERFRDALAGAESISILGGGLIGLEVAATAATLGVRVDLFEPQERLLSRVASPTISEFMADAHLSRGVRLNLGKIPSVSRVSGKWMVRSGDDVICSDLLLVATGGIANTDIARSAGLTARSGIVVDEFLRTDDDHIFAIGDCAEFFDVQHGNYSRVETVQNANDQGRHVAKMIKGLTEPYRAAASFWSDQYGFKLQTVGLVGQSDSIVRVTGENGLSASATHYRDGELIGFEAINMPRDFAHACKKIGAARQAELGESNL